MSATVLALLSALVGVAFLVVLAAGALKIADTLEAIGAREPRPRGKSTSALCRIRFGVRAIETQTSPLGAETTRLNGHLESLAGALEGLRGVVLETQDAVARQEER